jgi:hypothetical protein
LLSPFEHRPRIDSTQRGSCDTTRTFPFPERKGPSPRGRSLTNERGRSANQPPPRSTKRLGVPLERPKPQFASGISERPSRFQAPSADSAHLLERPVRDVASTTASTKHPPDQTSCSQLSSTLAGARRLAATRSTRCAQNRHLQPTCQRRVPDFFAWLLESASQPERTSRFHGASFTDTPPERSSPTIRGDSSRPDGAVALRHPRSGTRPTVDLGDPGSRFVKMRGPVCRQKRSRPTKPRRTGATTSDVPAGSPDAVHFQPSLPPRQQTRLVASSPTTTSEKVTRNEHAPSLTRFVTRTKPRYMPRAEEPSPPAGFSRPTGVTELPESSLAASGAAPRLCRGRAPKDAHCTSRFGPSQRCAR